MATRSTRAFVFGAALILGSEAFADGTQDAAENFYRTYLALRQSDKMTGIPNEAQLARLAPLLTPGLRRLFSAATREQGYEVKMKFRYVEGRSRVKWTDRLVLRNDGGAWRVDDVRYRAKFAFGSGLGKDLKSSLKRIPAC